jgi:hypothetical protein
MPLTSRVLGFSAACLVGVFVCVGRAAEPLPTLQEAVNAKRDVWGEAAMKQTNGASYEFFEKVLPPPRYVNADFRFYSIVLSAPNATAKARLISNGSGVNLRGGSRSWNGTGTAVIFRVGSDEFRFGDILDRVSQPTLADGYQPIPQIQYAHGSEIYQLEAFASTDPQLSENAVVFVKFSLAAGTNGFITVELDGKSPKFSDGQILDENGQALVHFDQSWTWERQRAHGRLGTNGAATLAIVSRPAISLPLSLRVGETNTYQAQRAKCVATWNTLLATGMLVETPEPLVNHAWKNLLIQNFSLINSNRMNYSAGNQYEKMYAAESSDAAFPLLWWGFQNEFQRLLPVILDITDKRLPHHFAGHKLANIPKLYWQTRDAEFIKAMRPRWQKELDLILNDRTPENGLLSKENYCTDIEVPVYSFTADAQCWAALRDLVPVLEELGDSAEAARVREVAAQFKKDILAAVEKNTRRETEPPFIPMAFFHTEEVHDPITETRLGSYWDLVANYIIGSRLFVGSERELWLPRYMEEHGGLLMGLTRSAAADHSFWTGKNRTNPLYGMRYILDCLRRDDVERALVSFYGMLAHGMTRNTFIGAEGCSVEPLDEGGRFFYCPPNSSSNGQWLAVLRSLLLQDLDLDEDGRPETLRLLFGTPRRWLEDGKRIRVERAPSAFGPFSFSIESRLAEGKVIAEVNLPERNPVKSILLRARVPEAWHVTSATVNGAQLTTDERGTVDLSRYKQSVSVLFNVQRNNP